MQAIGRKMKTLLIVEDDSDIQEYYRILFAGLDVNMLQAYNGKQALDVIDSGCSVDLILLDVVLPEMSGEEFFGSCVSNVNAPFP